MGKLLDKLKGLDTSKLNPKQLQFVLEYLANGKKGRKAAISAGYAPSTAHVRSSELLRTPKIQNLITRIERDDVRKWELDRHEVVRQLIYALTRRVSDFVDEDGCILNANDLPENVQSIIDGIEVTQYIDAKTGNQEITTKYKLTPHATAREQAMKHKGLFAPEEMKHMLAGLPFDELYKHNRNGSGNGQARLEDKREEEEDGDSR